VEARSCTRAYRWRVPSLSRLRPTAPSWPFTRSRLWRDPHTRRTSFDADLLSTEYGPRGRATRARRFGSRELGPSQVGRAPRRDGLLWPPEFVRSERKLLRSEEWGEGCGTEGAHGGERAQPVKPSGRMPSRSFRRSPMNSPEYRAPRAKTGTAPRGVWDPARMHHEPRDRMSLQNKTLTLFLRIISLLIGKSNFVFRLKSLLFLCTCPLLRFEELLFNLRNSQRAPPSAHGSLPYSASRQRIL
jgi:hypothetical protein